VRARTEIGRRYEQALFVERGLDVGGWNLHAGSYASYSGRAIAMQGVLPE
jgi:hypothetical protein